MDRRDVGSGVGAGVRRRERRPAGDGASTSSSRWPRRAPSPTARGDRPRGRPGDARRRRGAGRGGRAGRARHGRADPARRGAPERRLGGQAGLHRAQRRATRAGDGAASPRRPRSTPAPPTSSTVGTQNFLWRAGPDDLGRRLGDPPRPRRPPAPRPSPSLGHGTTTRRRRRNLLARYCLLLDHNDVDGWVPLLHRHGTYKVYGRTFAGPDGPAADARRRARRAPPGRSAGHRAPRRRPRPRPAEPAVCRPGDRRRAGGAVYDDMLVRTDDGWRIASAVPLHHRRRLGDRPD